MKWYWLFYGVCTLIVWGVFYPALDEHGILVWYIVLWLFWSGFNFLIVLGRIAFRFITGKGKQESENRR